LKSRFDVIIIGAGAAGLAAARDLSSAGKTICILEGRQRIGGRIWTIHSPDLPLPIELGAEFIHGEAEETFAIVDAGALLTYELPQTYWWSSGGQRPTAVRRTKGQPRAAVPHKWRLESNFWEEMTRIRKRIPASAHDISFADFLKKQRGLSPRLRQMALRFVEGYHASHADRISAASLRASDEEEEDPKQHRIANGYDAVIEWLRAGLHPQRADVRLGSEVTDVSWRRGEVEVQTAPGETVRGKAAVVTIPIGVWKAPAGIRFDPPLREKQRAIEKLEVGHVVKIVFRFRERFWEAADFIKHRAKGKNLEDGMPLNFVHASDRFMPTWWTSAPARSTLLTGWAGGHAADRLLAEGGSAVIDRALDSLASTFAVKRSEIDRLLDSTHMHDWQADRFSRGAYSYAGIGGEKSHVALAKPVSRTLFFAGEATSGDETGTVAGAISSGKRVAKQILET
jgi:monoamine oxidase